MHSSQSAALGEHLIPLTPIQPYTLSEDELKQLAHVAKALRQESKWLEPSSEIQALQANELPPAALSSSEQRLLLDDFSVISHIQHVLGLEYYAARAFVRAGEGDVVLGTFEPLDGYIEYNASSLGLGASTYHYVPPDPDGLSYAVCDSLLKNSESFSSLVDVLSQRTGTLWIHPYMGHVSAWKLAQALNQNLERTVRMVAPPPHVCNAANDKVWFAHAVAKTLSERYVAPVVSASNASDAAMRLQSLAQENWPRISIKLADSASGMGTEIFTKEDLNQPTHEELTQQITDWLQQKDWVLGESPDVAIEPWFDDVLGSPSVQLWIPPIDAGTPIVEGIYDQLFYPDEPFVFLGSIPSQLSLTLVEELSETGAKIGRVFQELGYIGRCSFDTILVGARLEDAQIKYVECNGRWGGTSTPMTLMNRVMGDYRTQAYVASDFDHEGLKGMSFSEFASVFSDILYNVTTQEGWAVAYNVACLKPSGKLDIITFGASFEEARQRQSRFKELVESRVG